MKHEDAKAILVETRHPLVECPRGHAYRVPFRFFRRNVRKVREFICPICFKAFQIKKEALQKV